MSVYFFQEVPEKCLPLFQFIDLLESKYHCVVSVSDLNKLKDICKITDDLGTRTISLLQKIKTTSNSLSNVSESLVIKLSLLETSIRNNVNEQLAVNYLIIVL